MSTPTSLLVAGDLTKCGTEDEAECRSPTSSRRAGARRSPCSATTTTTPTRSTASTARSRCRASTCSTATRRRFAVERTSRSASPAPRASAAASPVRCGSEFGEPEMKAFMRAHEAHRGRAAGRARVARRPTYRVALLHYAPVDDDARRRTPRDLPVPRQLPPRRGDRRRRRRPRAARPRARRHRARARRRAASRCATSRSRCSVRPTRCSPSARSATRELLEVSWEAGSIRASEDVDRRKPAASRHEQSTNAPALMRQRARGSGKRYVAKMNAARPKAAASPDPHRPRRRAVAYYACATIWQVSQPQRRYEASCTLVDFPEPSSPRVSRDRPSARRTESPSRPRSRPAAAPPRRESDPCAVGRLIVEPTTQRSGMRELVADLPGRRRHRPTRVAAFA